MFLSPVFYLYVQLQYKESQLLSDAQTGIAMMGHLAAGQQLWVWLCRSCGKSRGRVEASIWCL